MAKQVNFQPRVFISSIEDGYTHVRDAAERAIERAGCVPVRAENFPSHRISPRTACLDGVLSSDCLVLILGAQYAGSPTPMVISAVEEEYLEARKAHKQILVYVEKVDHEARQVEFIKSVSGYITGHWRKFFSDADELETLIENDLKEVMPMFSTVNETNARKRLDGAFGDRPPKMDGIVWIQAVWTTLRDQEVIDPTKFIDVRFQKQIQQLAHSGEPSLFQFNLAKEIDPSATRLRIDQIKDQDWHQGRNLVLLTMYENGTLSIASNITGTKARDSHNFDIAEMFLISPDQIIERLHEAWGFANSFWYFIDEPRRHDPLLYNLALFDVEQRRLGKPNPNQQGYTLHHGNVANPLMIYDHSRQIARADLQHPEEPITHALKLIEMRFKDIDRSSW